MRAGVIDARLLLYFGNFTPYGGLMIHLISHKNEYIAVDVASGAVHALDELAYLMLGQLSPPLAPSCPQTVAARLSPRFSLSDIEETYAELRHLEADGMLFSQDLSLPSGAIKGPTPPIKALCLHVSHDCNLRCKYCFAQTGDFGTVRSLMSPQVARDAIDFVIASSANRRNIEIDFFGGEPLMAWETIKDTVEYANARGQEAGKRFRFTVTTNGVLLDDDNIAYINEYMSNAVLSVDGRREVNDRMRRTVSGAGSYDIIMPRFKKLVDSRDRAKDHYMRGTYTANNLDFAADVIDLYKSGFDRISVEPVSAPSGCGYELTESHLPRLREEYWHLADKLLEMDGRGEHIDFFHFNVDLDQGPCIIKRLRGCGAGCEYVAVTPEGDIYPCHQFVGVPQYHMGNVTGGELDRAKASDFANVSIYTRDGCSDCWAKYYCSGGCSAANYFANGDVDKNYDLGCQLERMRLECAIYLSVKRHQG